MARSYGQLLLPVGDAGVDQPQGLLERLAWLAVRVRHVLVPPFA